jgi:hypothetical protein
MSISKQIEEIKKQMCDDYCRYTNEGKTEGVEVYEMENSPCDNCPLNRL